MFSGLLRHQPLPTIIRMCFNKLHIHSFITRYFLIMSCSRSPTSLRMTQPFSFTSQAAYSVSSQISFKTYNSDYDYDYVGCCPIYCQNCRIIMNVNPILCDLWRNLIFHVGIQDLQKSQMDKTPTQLNLNLT